MIFKVLLLSIVCCLAAAGCSSRSNPQRAAAVTTGAQTVAPPVENATEPEAEAADEQAQPAPDNSEIVTSRDEIGSVVETRTFAANTFLDRVVLKTLPDGSKVGWVYAPDGEKRPLTDAQIAVAHGVDGDELAEMVGLKTPVEVKTQKSSEESLPPVVETAALSMPASPEPHVDTPAESESTAVDAEKLARAQADALDQRIASLQNQLSRLQLRSKKK